MKNFVLIGVAGYIAPRHLQAIKETGNNLLAAVDKHDSVGILDKYFPDCNFFTEFERFDRHCEKVKRSGVYIDYVVVCSPNYLHDAHIRFGLRIGADVICEKPVVINPWNVEALIEMEKESGRKVNCILQLRLHPTIVALKKKVEEENRKEKYDIDLKYITVRGNWYHNSWKGEESKSGGIVANIGIHFFDFLVWIFGNVNENIVIEHNSKNASGNLILQKANIKWMLSIEANKLPNEIKQQGKNTYRALSINGEEIEFNDGFSELHTQSYMEILNAKGFSLEDTKDGIQITHSLRNK
jgi:UDP-N-acetyl-2-amino-2-deoxyglucuronate dehydrogenase